MPTKSASRAAGKTNLVFLTPIVLVYRAIVYNVVSVEPIIVDVINPINESTLYLFIISMATAIEALPEIGLKMASGSISEGIFNILKNGFNKFVMAEITPDSLSKLIDKKRPSSVGNILYIIFKPSLEPSKKLSNTLFFSIKP